MLSRGFHGAEHALDAVFGVRANPLRQLGGLAWAMFWVSVASGAYAYAFYDTGVELAHASVERLSASPRGFEGVVRSLHRYASDGFVLATALHGVRELAYGRFHGFRAYSWATGVPLAAIATVSGIVGYWLVWDERAQFVAVSAAEWLGALPGLGPELVRNFIAPESVSNRFFSLLAFTHIGVSLLLLLGMWAHVQRIARPRSAPHRATAAGAALALVGLALAVPALSLPPAALDRFVAVTPVDWYFLFAFPLADVLPPRGLWAAAAALLGGAIALPWLVRRPRAPIAVVNDAQCNGCGRCVEDCPYEAVVLTGAPRARETRAWVIADACAGCGLCVGACPSSNPFRGTPLLESGIELPSPTVAALRARLDDVLRRDGVAPDAIEFGCAHATPARADLRTERIVLPCVGMLPPSFVEYARRRGAREVRIDACAPGDCEFRTGADLAHERLAARAVTRDDADRLGAACARATRVAHSPLVAAVEAPR